MSIRTDGDGTAREAITMAISQVGPQGWERLGNDIRRAIACEQLLTLFSRTSISDHGGMGPTPYYDRWTARAEYLLQVHDFSNIGR